MERRITGAVLIALTLAGCGRAPTPDTYELAGQILAIRAETQEVLIRHGDIVGFMPGMTMPFKVRDPRLLEGRAAGDLVTATLSVTPDAAWISTLTVTGRAPVPADAPGAFPAATGVVVLAPGDRVAETELQAADGSAVSLAAPRGRVTAVTFIYTRCPLPDFCPLMDRRFAELQHRAARDAGLAGRVRLVSVSFDPATDTPARLAEHATALGADPAIWQFATLADPAAIDRFAATFGINVIREADGTITHNLRTVVIDRTGRVAAVHDGNLWTADELLADLRSAAAR
ncbi:MAG: SCO family protein [Acidobacteriota bacterium]|nr:SCO family protein [Acidobacteriota bacterium]